MSFGKERKMKSKKITICVCLATALIAVVVLGMIGYHSYQEKIGLSIKQFFNTRFII